MKIGITGGIGSGKSEVTKYLRNRGENVICADEVSRQVVQPGEPGASAIRLEFGNEFFEADGTLNRKKLAEYVFSDKILTLRLNDILHPIIINRISKLASYSSGRVFIDAALLVQAGMHEDVDYVWLVCTDLKKRIERVLLRDKTDEQSILQRIKCQLADEELATYADEVIENNGNLTELHRKIDSLLKNSKYSEEYQ